MRQRLHSELADWWPLVSPSTDYADEARIYSELLCCGRAPAPRLHALELGSGGGHCSLHMRDGLVFTLSDVSPEMLAPSRGLQPDREHALGDMRTMRLGREFDAVFVHDAIMYMTTSADLEAACRTAFVHSSRGGVALLLPDFVRETFAAGPTTAASTRSVARCAISNGCTTPWTTPASGSKCCMASVPRPSARRCRAKTAVASSRGAATEQRACVFLMRP
jgi:hypothetical protein